MGGHPFSGEETSKIVQAQDKKANSEGPAAIKLH